MSTHLHLLRLVLEAQTALSVAARKGGERDDILLVTDAFGLPAIPASGLAGALRALVREEAGEAMAKSLFGHLDSDGGQRSRVSLSWGVCHGDDDQPLEAMAGEAPSPAWGSALVTRLRGLAATPIKRDRVSLDHRATARPRRKFDRSVVPMGTRFTVELRAWGDGPDDVSVDRLLSLLAHSPLRVGGGTRSGLGRLRVVRAHGRHFNLANRDDAGAFRAIPPRFDRPHGLPSVDLHALSHAGTAELTARMVLKAEGFLRIGQGDTPLATGEAKSGTLLMQKTEPVVRWDGGRGRLEEAAPFLPASSLKGALSERVGFHAHRRAGRFVENCGTTWMASETLVDATKTLAAYDKNEHVPEVRELFGHVTGEASGNAGRVYIDDIELARPEPSGVLRVTHNVIDRFTGGVREHLLFAEEVLYQPTSKGDAGIIVTLSIRRPEGISPGARLALRDALDDLTSGLLPLGAASTRGNGFFTGEIQWSDGGRWIEGAAA